MNTETNIQTASATASSLERVVMRRVVTISVSGVANNAGTQCNYITTAVCDDGSMWWLRDNDAEWRELPPIPQPHNEKVSDGAGGKRGT